MISSNARASVLAGMAGGLAGGLMFGVLMGMMGMLPMVAMLVGSSSAATGLIVHLGISLAIGAGLALVLGLRPRSVGVAVWAGLAYGAAWWVLGPLMVMPILLGMGPQITLAGMVGAMPSLMGHLIFGGIAGLVYGLLSRSPVRAAHGPMALRG